MPYNWFAYTAPGIQPEFISLNKLDDGSLALTVRSAYSAHGASTAVAALPIAEAHNLLSALQRELGVKADDPQGGG